MVLALVQCRPSGEVATHVRAGLLLVVKSQYLPVSSSLYLCAWLLIYSLLFSFVVRWRRAVQCQQGREWQGLPPLVETTQRPKRPKRPPKAIGP